MTKQEYLMIVAMEECAEVAQELSKCIRFGPYTILPGSEGADNSDRVRAELNDLIAVLEMIYDECDVNILGDLPGEMERQKKAKKAKVTKFMPEDLK